MRRKILLIHNPVAGRRNRARLEAVEHALARLECSVTVYQTAKSGDAESFARTATTGGWDAVVGAGGDGTVNEVLNGLGRDSPPLGIVPLGTANVLAAEIGLSGDLGGDLGGDPVRIAETLVSGPVLSIYPGQAADRRFAMMASVGFDARVVAAVTPGLKRALGKGAYLLEALRQLAGRPLPLYDVTIDQTGYRAGTVIVANAKHYAGRFVCAPEANLREPGFQVCLIPGRRRDIIRAALALALGRLHLLSGIRIVAGRRIVLSGPPGEPVQMDGEVAGQLPLTVETASESIALIVPADQVLP